MTVLQALLVLLSTPGGQVLLLAGESLFLKLLAALHVHISTAPTMTPEQIAEYQAVLAVLSGAPTAPATPQAHAEPSHGLVDPRAFEAPSQVQVFNAMLAKNVEQSDGK